MTTTSQGPIAPYFPFPIVTPSSGMATQQFQNYWKTAIDQAVAAALAAQAAQTSADGAEAAAVAAQAAAGAAQTAATAAQGTASTALTNAAAAQATANAAAPNNSPTLTGDPKAPTPTPGDNDTSIATTAFVQNAVFSGTSGLAPINNPVFTGDPKAPTPTSGDNDTSIATTAFVTTALAGYTPLTAAWTAYTPTVSASSGTLTTASATGRWLQMGKTVFVFVDITVTTNGTGSGSLNFTLPVLPKNASILVGREILATGKLTQAQLVQSNITASSFYYDNSYPGANGTEFKIGGVYEAA